MSYIVTMLICKFGRTNEENMWVEIKNAQAGWSSAVGFLAVYRLESSEKEIHLTDARSESVKLAPTSAIALLRSP